MVTVETIPVLGIVCGGNQLWLNGSAGCATVSAEVGPDTWEKSTCDASFSPSALLKVGYAPKCWLTCAAPLIATQATATIDNAFTRARAGRRTAIANAAAPSPVHSTATRRRKGIRERRQSTLTETIETAVAPAPMSNAAGRVGGSRGRCRVARNRAVALHF
ncbi:hypothetical protein [Rhodococcus sp. EPR-157]|jgi:hypothetical protein|uniref:hypothetical protein n=1 Tax=Rhodococcus sp. EPR-157 TaxID=1813677 RepID=UPI000837EF99|nr:hypothetical protein BJF84_20775 [Rhodococcus sp. CUA-806]